MKELGWDDDFFSEQELIRDNEIIKQQLGLSNKAFHKVIKLTPYLEHQFLRYIQEFEEMEKGPKRQIISVFPYNFAFPPPESMNENELEEKLREIEEILEEHDIYLEFNEQLPPKLVYEYLINEELYTEIALEFPNGVKYHINGCDGFCPGCFQKDYCETGRDVWL